MHKIGDVVAITMHIRVHPIGEYCLGNCEPEVVPVAVVEVTRLGCGRTRYRAVDPRPVEWLEPETLP